MLYRLRLTDRVPLISHVPTSTLVIRIEKQREDKKKRERVVGREEKGKEDRERGRDRERCRVSLRTTRVVTKDTRPWGKR